MCVELALLGYCALVHIKGAHALFPKDALDDALRGLEHHVGHVFLHACLYAHAPRLYSPPHASLKA